MDFNAKRLALLAGVGNSEDRHDIVREYAQQLNESAEARQLNEAEEAVRKAVRRTIQKMISEGNLDFANTGITGGSVHVMEEEELSEDSIDDELEHLRKNVEDDKEHIDNLKRDIKADREEAERARKAKDRKDEGAEDLNEDEDEVVDNPGAKADDDPSRKGDHRGAYDLKESDATLRRLQALAGLQVLTEGYTDDELRELCHSKDHNCALVVEHPEWGRGKPIHGSHALPDDEGNVEWYDVQFKHGVEKKVMAEDVEVLKMGSHYSEGEMDEDEVEEAHCSEDEDHMEEGQDPEVTDGEMVPTGRGPAPRSMAYEGEDHDEAKLYELEDGRMYMEMNGKKFMMQEMEEELNELEEAELERVGQMDGKDVLRDKDGNLHTAPSSE